MSERWVLLNQSFCLEKEAFIPISDRGFLFGDGMFTTIRVHEGKYEMISGHLCRLQHHAKVLHFTWNPLNLGLLDELIKKNQATKGLWRLKIIVTVKEEEGKRISGQELVTLQPAPDQTFIPCALCLFPYPIETPLAPIKSLSYLEHLYIRDYGQKRGYADAIAQTAKGVLLETGCSNLFWIDQGQCWIPDFQLPYLKGVFLQTLMSHLAIPIRFVQATVDQIPSSANVYICNALTHIRPVISIEQASFSRNLQEEERLCQATARALQGNR